MAVPHYLESLNSAQQEAALCTEGPLLILAGAGSGKTRVITHRIVHLIHQGVAPSKILAVTFTNKAAKEMRDRVIKLLDTYPPSASYNLDEIPVVSTFHALGVRLLREFHHELSLRKQFVIYDRADSLRTIKRAMEILDYNPKEFEPKKILGTISKKKGEAMTAQEFSLETQSFKDEVIARTWEHYEQLLTKDHALDFDDLLLKTLKLLNTKQTVREKLQKRFYYLHVDEYQDTNGVQFKIAKQLIGHTNNICVVGDVDQNIYSWRGADIQNVLQFENHYQNAKTIWLEQNYRSTQTIIGASNDIINQNKNRIPKEVFTKNPTGEPITLYTAMNGNDEAQYVATTIDSLIKDGVPARDIAVLYRTNFQSRALEEACLSLNIPYQLLGTKFFERKEVKDIISYLRYALNPDSSADLARIINTPTRGIGKVTLLKLLEDKRNELTSTTASKVEQFESIIEDIRDTANTKTVSETLAFIIARSGMETNFKKEGTEEAMMRLENVRELVSYAKRFDELGESGADEFLSTVSLQSDQDELDNQEQLEAVRLMTVHAAKGLEFPYVFITGLEEGLFPHERLDDKGVDNEEERRLFYVALTRAGEKVYLTYAHMRTIFGSSRVNIPSSFLNDISSRYIETESIQDNSSGYETTVYLD